MTIELNVINESEDESSMTDDEVETQSRNDLEIQAIQPSNLTTLTGKVLTVPSTSYTPQNVNSNSYKDWRPIDFPPQAINKLAQRRIYRENKAEEPTRAIRIPVEVSVFGKKIRGIIDSGSERSFLSETAYDRVKDYQTGELVPDSTSRVGVRLGDQSVVKTLGGAGFIIDIGDVYGPQWFSILPGLSGDLILGMDFWLTFKVVVNPFSQTWNLADSSYTYPMALHPATSTRLQVLTLDQTQKLKNFLDIEFAKFDKDSTGKTDLITHVIELDDPTPYRQKPYRRSEIVRRFINEETDRLLEKGYITWSNSEWACSPVVAPKANGGLRFCINYQPVNRQTKKPAYPLHNMRSILSQLHEAKIIS